VVSSTPRPHLPPEKTRYPFYGMLGGPQGRSGRAENLVPTRFRSRSVQHRSQSLYRLSYSAHKRLIYSCNKNINLSPLVYILALYSFWESEYSNFLLVFHMWPLSTSMIIVSYCCSYVRPIVCVPYATEIEDNVGNAVALLLGFPVFEVQPGDHVNCQDPSCLSNDPVDICCDGCLK